ncbi:unnamed protein product [Zymoseptoria tritici ST99CH_1E4]|uniref:Uncharacterized protein n=1 Tax=Zymoseptoria tritici ST99CH_1E4 TaxID=1276532 RepID=A0A2H1GBI9_ZYMTR|nr:unnamed protein product [Zymoseptoria tritici ST99CH_1E4]
MKACKNELTHVALRASSLLDVESTIGHAQNIIPQFQKLDGYYPTEGKSGLRQISTTIEDIIFDTGDRDIWIQTNGVQGVSRASVIESLAPQFVIPCFPRPMEVLIITENFDDLCGEIPPDEMAKWYNEGLAAMISCKNIYEAAEIFEEERLKFEEMYERDFARRLADHVEGEVLLTREVENYNRRARQPVAISEDEYTWPNMKAIYIDPCVLWQDDGLPVAPKTHLWLQKAIKAGIERGVDVRTRTNVKPLIHRDIFLLTPPNPMALRSSPRRNMNLEDQVFDVFSRQWTTRGCNNCARCDDCHGLFPEELWDEAYRTPEDAQVR